MIKIKNIQARGFFLLSMLAVSLTFTGCGLWNNFTTYFNLYYNAQRLFDESEQEIIQQKKNFFSIQDPRPAGNASSNLTKVIEKLSKLLQFNAKSAYVDDALLMIGKSFYYQQEYQKAIRKFTELISTSPNSELAAEAQFWLARTQLRLKNYTQATAMLDELAAKALEDENDQLLTRIYTEQVGYFIAVEKYNDAVVAAQKLIETSDDDELNAAAMFEIGRLNLKMDQPERAAQAFEDVENYSPTFDIQYLSRIQLGKVQRRLGKHEDALDIFHKIEEENKYQPYLDSTKLQIGLTYLEMKNYPEAVSQLIYIDTTFKQSPNVGVAEYYLGEIMEFNYKNYDSAVYYYRKASSSAAGYEITQKATRKGQLFNKYTGLHQSLTNYTNQLRYALNPAEFKKDSIEFVRETARLDSLEKERAKNEEFTREEVQARNRRGTRSDDPQGNQKNRMAPLKPLISADSLAYVIAKNEYDLGSLFFTELNVPDSARYYFERIVERTPKTSLTPKALFALGSYYQTISDTVKADSIFTVIYRDYPKEDIVNAAAEKLGKPLVNLHYDAAEELFVQAEQKMKEKKFDEAVAEFQTIQEKYPRSPFAPKALYASGWVLENDLKLLDSAAVVYDTLASKYPSTQYASAVRGKVQIFKAEQKRIKMLQDTTAAGQDPKIKAQAGTDSLQTGRPQAGKNPAAGQTPQAGSIQNNTVTNPAAPASAREDSVAARNEIMSEIRGTAKKDTSAAPPDTSKIKPPAGNQKAKPNRKDLE